MNETLQLQRLAYEEIGLGTWSGGAKSIPTTLAGEELGVLDLTDLDHPRLSAPLSLSQVDDLQKPPEMLGWNGH